ncbi:MAG TPA: potassium/proton antiporter [Bacteroidales bacterium]|nr:potassium/proton antiporter [Bacteroidales bacterium]
MDITSQNFLLIGSLLLFVSIIAGKTSYKFGIPVVVLFISIGMLAGSEGIGGIYFDNPNVAQFIGIIALNFILFSGGLDTDWNTIKPIMRQGISLSVFGVILTAGTFGVFVWYITDFTIYESLLLGSIISSTDAAAVFSILRSKSVALKNNLRPTLELESGSNDPMAYILTIVFTGLVVNQQSDMLSIIPSFLSQLVLGAVLGFGCGYGGKLFINRIHLDYEGLYVILVIAIMFFAFSLTDFIGGNGFLAIYICGVYLGNQELLHKKKLLKSFDSFALLMQIVLFLTLGLLVYPSELLSVVGIGLILSVFLIFVARPLSVFLCLLPFKMKLNTKLYISWVGLRGAVPIVFATYPLIAGVGKADLIFDIVFFISLTSVIVQGSTVTIMAKWLKVILPANLKKRTISDMELNESIKTSLTKIVIPEGCSIVGKKIVDVQFPKTSIISYIIRNGSYIIPNGSTVLQENDQLFVLSETQLALQDVYKRLEMYTY